MSSSSLIRWGGLLSVVAGVLAAVGTILLPAEDAVVVSGSLSANAHVLLVASLLFVILALFALYARQVKETGVLGMIGFLAAFTGSGLLFGFTYVEAFIFPVFATEAPEALETVFAVPPSGALAAVLPLTGLLFALGWLLFGIAIIRAGILPRWGAVLAIIGAVPLGLAPLFPPIVTNIAAVVFGLGLIWLGNALWSEKR